MKKLFLTLVALMGATTLFAQTDMVASFQQAMANAKAKNYVEAIEQFQAVIDAYYEVEEPDANQEKAFAGAKKFIVTCYHYLGGAAYNAKNYDEAAEYFAQAADQAELFDNVADMTKNRQFVGKCFEAKGAEAFNTGDYATAIEVFSKGYAADNRNTSMALNLAESYFKLNEYQKGMDVCNNICGMNPSRYAEAIAAVKEMMVNGEWDVFSGVKLNITVADGEATVEKVDAALESNGYQYVDGDFKVVMDDVVVVEAGGASVDDGVIKGSMNYLVKGVEEV